MFSAVSELGVPIVLMHLRGTPADMQDPKHTQYTDVVREVSQHLTESAVKAQEAGIARWNILLDPGLGFAKTVEQNVCVGCVCCRYSLFIM